MPVTCVSKLKWQIRPLRLLDFLFRLKKYRYQTSGFTFQILFKNFIIRFLMKNIKNFKSDLGEGAHGGVGGLSHFTAQYRIA